MKSNTIFSNPFLTKAYASQSYYPSDVATGAEKAQWHDTTFSDLDKNSLLDEEIIENTMYDYYWGCGTNGGGRNMLGKILMEAREILRAREQK